MGSVLRPGPRVEKHTREMQCLHQAWPKEHAQAHDLIPRAIRDAVPELTLYPMPRRTDTHSH